MLPAESERFLAWRSPRISSFSVNTCTLPNLAHLQGFFHRGFRCRLRPCTKGCGKGTCWAAWPRGVFPEHRASRLYASRGGGKEIAGISAASCWGRVMLSRVCAGFPSVLAKETEASQRSWRSTAKESQWKISLLSAFSIVGQSTVKPSELQQCSRGPVRLLAGVPWLCSACGCPKETMNQETSSAYTPWCPREQSKTYRLLHSLLWICFLCSSANRSPGAAQHATSRGFWLLLIRSGLWAPFGRRRCPSVEVLAFD